MFWLMGSHLMRLPRIFRVSLEALAICRLISAAVGGPEQSPKTCQEGLAGGADIESAGLNQLDDSADNEHGRNRHGV